MKPCIILHDMIYDFHTHSTLSDGAISPLELTHRAIKNGYHTITITDHVGIGQLERFITEVTRDCILAEKCWDIVAIPGVELTPPHRRLLTLLNRLKKWELS